MAPPRKPPEGGSSILELRKDSRPNGLGRWLGIPTPSHYLTGRFLKGFPQSIPIKRRRQQRRILMNCQSTSAARQPNERNIQSGQSVGESR